jgi:hypothetical protein
MPNQYKDGHGGWGTRLYGIWSGMISRCKPGWPSASYHGDRGIAVCEEWRRFQPFRDWALLHGYADNLQLDRADNAGNYEPRNCRWVTPKQQARNTKLVKAVVRSDGAIYGSIAEAAEAVRSHSQSISAVCRGHRKTAGGFGWSYH